MDDRREQALVAALCDARDAAERNGFDLPEAGSYQRAAQLLKHLAVRTPALPIEVAVGDDGSIEITAVCGQRYFVIDVSPSGGDLHLMVEDLETRSLTFVAKRTNEDEIVRQMIERAA